MPVSAIVGPVLVVVAHPDDEVLGCGATAAALVNAGVEVATCIVCGGASARRHRPEDDELAYDLRVAHDLLGMTPVAVGDFPNIRLNTVPHLELVEFVEGAVLDTGARTVFTHHPHDLNDDHLHTAKAARAAARLFQRRREVPPLSALYYMEVLSSTEWSFPGLADPFRPDTFAEVGTDGIDKKVEALAAYRGVMRPYPHPRSDEAIRGLAALRGGQSGMMYAEAFQTAYATIHP